PRRFRVAPSFEALEGRRLLAFSQGALRIPELAEVRIHGAIPRHAHTVVRVFEVPESAGELVSTIFTYAARHGRFRNELGLVVVDDADGRISGLAPGDRRYAAAALASASRRVIFAQKESPRAVTKLDLPGGSRFILYLVQNATTTHVLKRNVRAS